MSHKKSGKFVRKVVKNGRGSYYINIPHELVGNFPIRERQKLVISRWGKSIIIRDWPVKRTKKK